MPYYGFGASGASDPLLQWLSSAVFIYRAHAFSKCPALDTKYNFLTNSIAAALKAPDFSSAEDLAEELANLNSQCGISDAPTGLPAAPKAKKTTTTTAAAKPAAPAASVSVAPVGPDPLTSSGSASGSSWTFAPAAPAAASGGSSALLLGAAAIALYLLWS